MKILATLFTLMIALSLTACGGGEKDHDHKDHGHKDHKHKDETTKKDETSKKDHKDDDHGKAADLGKADVDGTSVAVTQYGHVHAGEEAVVDVTVSGGDHKPSAVRVWVGVESAQGSIKSLLSIENGKYHGHCDAPDPLPAGSKIWVELEAEDGHKHAASFDFKS